MQFVLHFIRNGLNELKSEKANWVWARIIQVVEKDMNKIMKQPTQSNSVLSFLCDRPLNWSFFWNYFEEHACSLKISDIDGKFLLDTSLARNLAQT